MRLSTDSLNQEEIMLANNLSVLLKELELEDGVLFGEMALRTYGYSLDGDKSMIYTEVVIDGDKIRWQPSETEGKEIMIPMEKKYLGPYQRFLTSYPAHSLHFFTNSRYPKVSDLSETLELGNGNSLNVANVTANVNYLASRLKKYYEAYLNRGDEYAKRMIFGWMNTIGAVYKDAKIDNHSPLRDACVRCSEKLEGIFTELL